MTGSDRQCDLCGLSVGRGGFAQRFAEEEREFCCLGCLNVYTILSESGAIASGEDIRENEVFKRSLALGLISQKEEETAPEFRIPEDAPIKETLLHVSGMWCGACAWLIEHSLLKERGVVSVEAYFVSDLVKIKYSPLFLPPERIAKRIRQLGYIASEYEPDDTASKRERRDLLLRIGVAAFLWLNIMDLSVPLYVGYFEEIAPSVKQYLPLILMVLSIPIVVYSAKPIFQVAFSGLVNRTVRMETLLTGGILAAFLYSSFQAFRGTMHVYFDTVAAIVTLVLVGKLIEKSAKQRATQAISMLYRLMPKKARIFVERAERFVSIDALKDGDIVVVKAGERIPADGVIIEGETHTDESLLTGESTPISRNEGDVVVSGSVNISDLIRLRATRTGADTTLAQIIQLVERAIGSRSTMEQTADKVSRMFVPGVIAVALATFFVGFGLGFTTLEEALLRAITVLVIACPCSLGLATPLAITAAVGTASRQGVLISDATVLEKVRDVNTVVFDKTGTVTEGRFEFIDHTLVTEEETYPPAFAAPVGSVAVRYRERARNDDIFFEKELLPLLSAVERYSEHPLGSAIGRYAERCLVTVPEAENVSVSKGKGISGTVRGRRVAIGNRALMEGLGAPTADSLDYRVHEWETSGYTVAQFAIDGELKGAMAFGDAIRPEADSIVRALKERHIRSVIVSGDAEATTRSAARNIGADDFRAGVLPAEKADFISSLQKDGSKVAMIGDGINDAPALAQADLGVAMGSGTDIAMKAADMVLIGGSLEKILAVFDLSKKTTRIVNQNLFWAFAYNIVGVSLAVTGILNPIAAAAAMLLSSLSVIANSMRLGSGRVESSLK